MKRYRGWLSTLLVGGLAVLSFACQNTAQGAKKDAEENAEKARQEAYEAKESAKEASKDAAQAAREAGRDIKEESKDVGDKVAQGARDVGDKAAAGMKDAAAAVDAAKQTVDVKGSLIADSSIDASHIDVDTDRETKTVTLKGSVPTAAQRAAAERIARDKAEGYRVRNQLKVVANP